MQNVSPSIYPSKLPLFKAMSLRSSIKFTFSYTRFLDHLCTYIRQRAQRRGYVAYERIKRYSYFLTPTTLYLAIKQPVHIYRGIRVHFYVPLVQRLPRVFCNLVKCAAEASTLEASSFNRKLSY